MIITADCYALLKEKSSGEHSRVKIGDIYYDSNSLISPIITKKMDMTPIELENQYDCDNEIIDSFIIAVQDKLSRKEGYDSVRTYLANKPAEESVYYVVTYMEGA